LVPNNNSYSILYSFITGGNNLASVQAGLVQGADGTLYGTAVLGGSSGCGGVFKITTNGANYSILYSFSANDPDGGYPYAPVIIGQDGALYGTDSSLGAYDGGTVFRLAPPAPPKLGLPAVFAAGSLRFSLTAPAGQSCQIDVSTNLVNWAALTNIVSGTNPVQIFDTFDQACGERFYRASYSTSQ
jgi:uncharacterized repeat protein (TIGR03803 family)